MNKIKINYLSAFCGAGKTFGLSEFANRLALQGYKVLIVQPTTRLIGETIRVTFPLVGVTARHTAITTETHENCVKVSIMQYLKNADDQGEILLITHSAFFELSYFDCPGDWIVIMDEIPLVERSFSFNIPDAHALVTQHLVITDRSNTAYWTVGPKGSGMHLKKIARNSNDDEVFRPFSCFAASVLSPHWDVRVLSENYQSLVTERDVPEIKRQLIASALMQPSVLAPFRKVIIAGACFTESLLYKVWSLRDDVEFEPVKVGTDGGFKLRYLSHDNGHLLDIYYALDNHWSKNARDKLVTVKDGTRGTIFDAITATTNALIGTEPKVALLNNDRADVIDQWENCEKLPNMAHGLNTFQDRDHAILLSAINPHPSHFKFLREFAGIEPSDVQTAMYRQTIYQAAARTSIRDQRNTNRKKWFVADAETAEWLTGLFKGAKLHPLNLFDPAERLEPTNKGGRPRKHADDAAKAKAARERKSMKERAMWNRTARLDIVNSHPNVQSGLKAQEWAEVETGMTEPANMKLASVASARVFMGTFFTSTDVFDSQIIEAEGSWDELVGLYREWSTMSYPDKESVPLWSPALYVERKDVDSRRGYANIAYVRHIGLDNDGGDLSPAQFAALFPAWRMMFHSSWSSSEAKPKWRVIIETDCVMDIEGYKAICAHIMRRLNDRGFWTAKQIENKPHLIKSAKGVHGFDGSKFNPACVLYIPSLGAQPEQAFFEVIHGPDRGPLDVYTVLANAELSKDEEEALRPPVEVLRPVYKPVEVSNPKLRAIAEKLVSDSMAGFERGKARKVETAMDRWSIEGDHSGQRDSGFWQLGVDLKRAGCDSSEIADHLNRAATLSMSKEKGKLRGSIKRIIRKLGV